MAGEEISVSVTVSNQVHYFKFVPAVSGVYTIESAGGVSGGVDPYGILYGANQAQITYDDDGAGSRNFRITYNLTAGETYYIEARCYNSNMGSYRFTVTAPVTLSALAHNPLTRWHSIFRWE